MDFDLVLRVFNGLGLPLLGIGLLLVYQALTERARILERTINSLREGYDAVVAVASLRSQELENLISRQQELHDSLLDRLRSKSDEHSTTLEDLYRREKSVFESQLSTASTRLTECQAQLIQLEESNLTLRVQVRKLEDENARCSSIKTALEQAIEGTALSAALR